MNLIQSLTSYLSFASATCARCGGARSRFGGARCKVCGLPKGSETPVAEPSLVPVETAPQIAARKSAVAARVRHAA